MNRKFIILLSILTLLILAVGCNSQDETSINPEKSEVAEEVEGVSQVTVEHRLGEASLQKKPERIIVFDYATLDTLDKMGIDIIGLPKSNIPTYLEKYNDEKYQDVGTLFEPNFEKVFELEPDVIFISGRQAEVYEELSEIAPTVFLEVDGANYMESVTRNLRILGEIFEKEEFIEAEIAQINEMIEELNGKVKEAGSNALIVMANDGAISAYGEGSRFGIIHNEFGFEPADKDIELSNHGQNVTFEYILEKNPDYIFVIDRAATTGGSVTAEQVFDNEIIKKTAAYQKDKIVYLSSQIWYVVSGGLGGTKVMIEDVSTGFAR